MKRRKIVPDENQPHELSITLPHVTLSEWPRVESASTQARPDSGMLDIPNPPSSQLSVTVMHNAPRSQAIENSGLMVPLSQALPSTESSDRSWTQGRQIARMEGDRASVGWYNQEASDFGNEVQIPDLAFGLPTASYDENFPLAVESQSYGPNAFSSINWLPMAFSPTEAESQTSYQTISAANVDTYSSHQSRVTDDTGKRSTLGALQDAPSNGNISDPSRIVTGESGHDHQLGESLRDTSDEEPEPGDFYVDGEGGRRPVSGKHHRTKPISHSSPSSRVDDLQDSRLFSFPQLPSTESCSALPKATHVGSISKAMYEHIVYYFDLTCLRFMGLFLPFQGSSFPPLDFMNLMLRQYFGSFHQVFPFLHTHTFDPADCHWVLVLAICAIGSHYVNFPDHEDLVRAMHEFLRRAIIIVVSTSMEVIAGD